MKPLLRLTSAQWLWIASVIASAPLIFWNAAEHDFPMGYAGLFTQMARQIAQADFLLPFETPYYGPGGIPFAYPPFSLYLLAVFIKLTGKYYFFLRWLPPLIALLSIALTFSLSTRLFKSPIIGAFTAVLAAASTDLYIAHAWSAGIVRAPAFVFAILAVYFFSLNLEARSTKNILRTGLFFGLSILSHLAYALFCAFWIGFFSLADRNRARVVRDSLLSALTGLLLASIWAIPVVSRHGWDVFLGAFSSHGGGSLFLLPSVRVLLSNFAPLTSNIPLAVLILFGGWHLLHRKRYDFVLFFLLTAIFFPENGRFVSWLGCFFAGCGLWLASERLYGLILERWNFLSRAGVSLISVPVLAAFWWGGFNAISRFTPLLTPSAMELARSAPGLFPKDSVYLALLIQDEAEWLPFLLEREPLVSQWGSEWLGEYDRQTLLMSRFQGCRREKDWLCVQAALDAMGASPQFLITYRIEWRLNEQILASGRWRDVHSNNRYVIWRSVGVR